MSRPASLTILLALVGLLGVGCGAADDDPSTAGGATADATPPEGPSGRLVVFAAASLTDAFEELGAAFEAAQGDVTVRFNFAGSQQLASQLLEGAPGDVYASADPEQMQRVVEDGLTATGPSIFAGNHMTIVVEPGNPEDVRGLEDLTRGELIVVLAGEEVPAGRYASHVLEQAGVDVRADSREIDVRQALAKVTVGEADAAIVYGSDAVAAGDAVTTIPVPGAVDVAARYPAAVLEDTTNPVAARSFVEFLHSPRARAILRESGFTTP